MLYVALGCLLPIHYFTNMFKRYTVCLNTTCRIKYNPLHYDNHIIDYLL